MIEVNNLTKQYPGGTTAIEGLTFTVGRGEVVGFLGPNGAGKSTTMRILSCFMPATSGLAKIAGFDVFRDFNEVRRKIGYMPENNPLHLDMRVRDYLKFRARLKGLSRVKSRERVGIVMQQCGLTEVTQKIIGHLSKGYRQRVGLADALVHEPELIILDEPTIGLDPHQIRSVRQLVKDLGKKHTVLLSTHILSEVEMTCSRVLIMHQGKIRAADATSNLQKLVNNAGGAVETEVAVGKKELIQCLDSLDQVQDYTINEVDSGYFRCHLVPSGSADLRPLIFEEAKKNGWKMRELSRKNLSLEDIFVRITQSGRAEEDLYS